jgi:glyoxylase-like metal-dependent hydrolase (beta-lactamase superfamily II)
MFEKIGDSLYAITDGSSIGNVGLIATEEGNYVIDTSMYPKMANEMISASDTINTGKLKGVIITHYHGDHVFGIQQFEDTEIIAHKYTHENMKNALNVRWTDKELQTYIDNQEDDVKDLFKDLRIILPNTIMDEETLDLGEIVLYHLGGHTSGSTIVYHKTERAVFVGDLIFSDMFPWAGDETSDIYQWRDAMDFIISLNPKLIIPGHGQIKFNLDEIKYYRHYFQNIISLAEILVEENTEISVAENKLSEIDFYTTEKTEWKKLSISHFYKTVLNKTS